jgi:hypothetical protein
MNDIKKALDSGMTNIHFDERLVLNNYKRQRSRNSMLKKISLVVVATALVIVCMTTETTQLAFAYVYQSIANIMEKNDKVNEYTTVIGKSVTDNGITVTLNDAIVSERKLILSFNYSDMNLLEDKEVEHTTFGIGGIKVYMDGNEMSIVGQEAWGQDLDEHTYNNIAEFYVGSIAPEEEHEFEIAITQISETSKETSGNWTFNFAASGEAMAKDTKVIMLDNVLNNKDYSIIFEKFVSNSYEKSLYVSYSDGAGYADRGGEFDLIGYDDLGNEVRLYAQPDYYNEMGTIFIPWGGWDISDEASTLTLQVGEWPFEFDAMKESVTVNIK